LCNAGNSEGGKTEEGRYPDPAVLVDYVKKRILPLSSAPDPSKPLAIPPKTFLALVGHHHLIVLA
jgi:hypothetical protein